MRYQRLALACGLLAMGSTAPAQAGLLDFLFGQPSRPQYYVPYHSPQQQPPSGFFQDPAERKAQEAAKRAAAERRAAEQATRNRELAQQLSEVAREHGPKAAFMLDPTLRPGDIVVTSGGLEVFQGSRGNVHSANAFRPLSQSSLRSREDLARLQQASNLVKPEAAPTAAELRPLTISGSKSAKKKSTARRNAPATTPQARLAGAL